MVLNMQITIKKILKSSVYIVLAGVAFVVSLIFGGNKSLGGAVGVSSVTGTPTAFADVVVGSSGSAGSSGVDQSQPAGTGGTSGTGGSTGG